MGSVERCYDVPTLTRAISVQELHRRQAAGGRCEVIDVRTPAEFAAAHVPGARNLPLGSPGLAAWAHELPTGGDEAFFVICQSGGRSRRCCDELAATGVRNAVSVEGGTQAWAEAGLPLEHVAGAGGVISLERQVRIAAGALVLVGCGLGWWLHAGFFGLAALVGAGLVFAGVTDFCGMGLLLARMPWNRR